MNPTATQTATRLISIPGERAKCLDRSGAPGARTQNPRIKSPLLYH
jgi:hypothetical protein